MSSRNHIPGTRRRFLKQAGAAAVFSSIASRTSFGLPPASSSSGSPTPVFKNRSPLSTAAFATLPLGSIRPTGWLRSQLEIQANGLGGHLDETWPDVGPNSGWLGGTGESWERGPYFVDGLVPLAYQLDDSRLGAKAQRFIDWTLASQRPDGMFGPASNDDWWPRMVMLKALTQYQEATADPRVMPLLSRYFAYQLKTLPSRPLKDWGKFRWQDNVLSVRWLYNRNGDPSLLSLARLLHAQGYDWQADFADFKFTQRITPEAIQLKQNGLSDVALATHGVNNGQAIKAAPVWFLVTGRPEDRDGIHQMLTALDTYHGLPNGMFSCDEHFAGRNPSQGSELCTVVETMFSLEQSLAILGNPALGDRLERIAFNALPGAFTDDMWAHQYNQEPNQVECSLHREPWTTDGPESNLYGLEPNFGCCTANFHQGWPKFTSSLWMASDDSGLVAAAYAPCDLNTMVSGVPVRITEATEYPFRGTIRLALHPSEPITFPLHLRIPAWASGATLRVNETLQSPPAPGSFHRLNQTWHPGDVVELTLPLTPRIVPGFNDSVSIARGALVFSYPIGESWLKLRNRGLTADWQVYPDSQWNYALEVNDATGLHVNELPLTGSPFTRKSPPVTIAVSARRLPGWQALDGVAAPVPPSPVTSSDPLETITLIPYAAAKLRITAFPRTSTSSV